MKQEYDEETYESDSDKEEVDAEAEDELSAQEEGFLRGYDEDGEEPKEIAEEDLEY